jgi:signal transduction histidine kinase
MSGAAVSDALAELQARLVLLEDVFRCLPAGLIVIDDQEKIAICNPLADEIRGVGERIGGPVDECHPGRSRGALGTVLRRFRDGSPGVAHPIVLERANRWEVSYSRVTSSDGAYRGIAWLAHDISRQKQLQQQLLHQERIVGLGRMAAKLAHEVKNPLSIIAGAVHNLKRDADDDDGREMIAIIEAQLERLRVLIDRLREATRPLKPQPRPCAADRIVRDVAKSMHKDIDVSIEGGGSIAAVVDPELLERLVLNGIDNAIRAAGRVSVRLSIDTQANGEWLRIAFIDDGPGFSREVLNHLFEPFVTTRPDGTGLGLVIMREICLLHAGDLKVENRPEGGAVVTARLLTR